MVRRMPFDVEMETEEGNSKFIAFVPIPASITVEVWAKNKEDALQKIKLRNYYIIDSNSDSGDQDTSKLTVDDVMDENY